VLRGIESGFLHPSLAEDLAMSPLGGAKPLVAPEADWQADLADLQGELSRVRADLAQARRSVKAGAERIADLEEALAQLRASWTWRIGRMVTGPAGRLRRRLRRPH
jgi:hypothetical protein